MPIIPCLLALFPPVPQQALKQEPLKRFGILQDSATFEQKTPMQLRKSLLVALESKRIDYLLAHLADPEFIDQTVQKHYEGKFEGLVKESAGKLIGTPLGNQLQAILKEGVLDIQKNKATIKHPAHKDKTLYFRKSRELWYLENNSSPD